MRDDKPTPRQRDLILWTASALEALHAVGIPRAQAERIVIEVATEKINAAFRRRGNNTWRSRGKSDV